MEKIVDRLTTLSIFLLVLSAAVIFLVADRKPESVLYRSTTKSIRDAENAYRSLGQAAEAAVQLRVRPQLLKALGPSTPAWLRTIVATSVIRPVTIRFTALNGNLTNSLPAAVDALTTSDLLTVGKVDPRSVTVDAYHFNDGRLLRQELSKLGANYYPYFHQDGTVLYIAGPDRIKQDSCTIGLARPDTPTGMTQKYSFEVPCTPNPPNIDLTTSYYAIYRGHWQQPSTQLPPGYGYLLPFGEERDALLAEALKRSTEPQARTAILGGIDLGISELRTVAACVIAGVLLLMLNLSRSANRPPVSVEPRPVYWYGLFRGGWMILPIAILIAVPTVAIAACTGYLELPIDSGLEIGSAAIDYFYHQPVSRDTPIVTAKPVGSLKLRSPREESIDRYEKILRDQEKATSDPEQKRSIAYILADEEQQRKSYERQQLILQMVRLLPALAVLIISCLVVWENTRTNAIHHEPEIGAPIW